MSQHRVYALASGKGGVGKTTSAVNLGAALVDAGHTVAVVDVDLGMANVGDVLELDVDGPSLHEVLAGEASVEEATYHVGRFGVVPGGTTLDAYADADPERLGPAIESLRETFDYVLLDVGAGLSHDTVLPLGLADAVLLVATPDRPAIVNARKVAAVTNRLGGTVDGVLITRAGADNDVAGRVEAELDVPLRAIVPEDPAVARSAEAGVPVVVTDPDAPVAEAYVALAAILDGSAADDGPATTTGAPPSEPTEFGSAAVGDPAAEPEAVAEGADPASAAPDPLSDPAAPVDEGSGDEVAEPVGDPLAPSAGDADQETADVASVGAEPAASPGDEASDDEVPTDPASDDEVPTDPVSDDEVPTDPVSDDEAVTEPASDDEAVTEPDSDDSADVNEADAKAADTEATDDASDDSDGDSADETGVTINATPIDLEGAMEGISLGGPDEDVDALLDDAVAEVEGRQDETARDNGDAESGDEDDVGDDHDTADSDDTDDSGDAGESDGSDDSDNTDDSDSADDSDNTDDTSESDDPPNKKGFFRRLFG